MRLFASVSVILVLISCTAFGLDLAKLDRSIEKEPSYQSKSPRYCLLVFGKEARSRVWLVVDGQRLYIDRNGNGDLTEPGESVKSVPIARSFEQIFNADGLPDYKNFRTISAFDVDQIRETGGTAVHTNLEFTVYDRDRFSCSIELAGGRYQSVGGRWSPPKPRLAARPQDAPIIHFNGPLTFARHHPTWFLTRLTRGTGHSTIRVWIGTPGLGEGTFARHGTRSFLGDDGHRMVTADFEFPSSGAGGDPIRRRDQLKLETCNDYGYCTFVRAPVEAGSGFAKITLSANDWKEEITPATINMLIVGNTHDIPKLTAALQTDDAAMRERIISALRRRSFGYSDHLIVKALVEQLGDPDPRLRIGAIRGMAEWKTPRVVALLIEALDNPDVDVRAAAIRALRGGNDRPEEVVPKLVTALSAEDPNVRRAAAYASHGYAPHSPAAAQALVESLGDPDHVVRGNAAASLAFDGPESISALPKLVLLLHDEQHHVRSAAARAIGSIDRSAIPPLIEKLKKSAKDNETIRELGASALRAMNAHLRYQSGDVTDIRFYDPPRDTQPSGITSDDLKVLPQLAEIGELNHLRALNLGYTQISDDGLQHLENLTELTYLGLEGTYVSNDGLAHLEELKKLTVLHLQNTRITSAGLAHITQMGQLKILGLGNSSVDDAATVHIARLKELDSVFLNGTQVTKQGQAELRRQLPGCFVGLTEKYNDRPKRGAALR